jgi:phage shock protein C
VAAFFGHESFIAMAENQMYNDEQVHALIEGVFNTKFQYITFYIGTALVTLIPSIAFLLLGIRLLFDYKRIPGITAIVLLILWLVGVGMLSACGFNMFREFHVETEFTERVPIELPIADTLYLDITDNKNTLYKFRSEFDHNQIMFDGGVTFQGENSTDVVYDGETSFTVEINRNDTVYELFIERSARGANQKDAVYNARQVQSTLNVSNDSLMISPLLVLPEGTKIRNQEVKYILRIPVGKSIHFTENSKAIIYDIPNVTNTLDRKMLNKTWIMTEDGLMNEKISMAEALKLQQKEVEEAQEQLEEVQELLEAEQLEREKELERLERNNDD